MSKEHPIEVRDMAIGHRLVRQAYAEAARLVRARPTPSSGRVTFLADHIDFGIAALHHHHEGEDEMLYPKLIERVPDQAPMTAPARCAPAAPIRCTCCGTCGG